MIRKPCLLNLIKFLDANFKLKNNFSSELDVIFYDGKLGFKTIQVYYEGATFYHF